MNIKITLPDGSIKEVPTGTTPAAIAVSISEGLARNVLAAKFNDVVIDSNRELTEDGFLQLLTWNDNDGKSTFWHSSAHLMAEAIEQLYPGSKFWVGPAIENGFYYDINTAGQTISQDDFKKIEDLMLSLAREKNDYV
ncbi:MAG: TGS domain-containing protein, partial [Spirosomaceae bacterium]|nr:TGS domain-containing protein [Spirosomataceae bacterium]